MKPITIKARSITPVLEAARELVLACEGCRLSLIGTDDHNDAECRISEAEERLASLLGLERDEKTGRYV